MRPLAMQYFIVTTGLNLTALFTVPIQSVLTGIAQSEYSHKVRVHVHNMHHLLYMVAIATDQTA